MYAIYAANKNEQGIEMEEICAERSELECFGWDFEVRTQKFLNL